MITVTIRGAGTLAKMAEIKPVLGERHEFGTYWREGELRVDYSDRADADLVVNQLNYIQGVHARIVEAG